MDGISESLKILNQKSVSMTDLSKVYRTLKGKIPGVTWQSVRTKASRPLLKELLKSKETKREAKKAKKLIDSGSKKMKRDDEDIEKVQAQLKTVGRKIKKAVRKDKGKLGELT